MQKKLLKLHEVCEKYNIDPEHEGRLPDLYHENGDLAGYFEYFLNEKGKSFLEQNLKRFVKFSADSEEFKKTLDDSLDALARIPHGADFYGCLLSIEVDPEISKYRGYCEFYFDNTHFDYLVRDV